jgi:hypothetical protein
MKEILPIKLPVLHLDLFESITPPYLEAAMACTWEDTKMKG